MVLWLNSAISSQFNEGASITERNGILTLILQADGNLVLYENLSTYRSSAIFSTQTNGQGAAGTRMVVLSNANGELYLTDSSLVKFYTNGVNVSASRSPFIAYLQLDNNLVVYDKDNIPIWASNTAQPLNDVFYSDYFKKGITLHNNWSPSTAPTAVSETIRYGEIRSKSTDGTSSFLRIGAGKETSSDPFIGIEFRGKNISGSTNGQKIIVSGESSFESNILPSSNNIINLGSGSLRFNNGYFQNINASGTSVVDGTVTLSGTTLQSTSNTQNLGTVSSSLNVNGQDIFINGPIEINNTGSVAPTTIGNSSNGLVLTGSSIEANGPATFYGVLTATAGLTATGGSLHLNDTGTGATNVGNIDANLSLIGLNTYVGSGAANRTVYVRGSAYINNDTMTSTMIGNQFGESWLLGSHVHVNDFLGTLNPNLTVTIGDGTNTTVNVNGNINFNQGLFVNNGTVTGANPTRLTYLEEIDTTVTFSTGLSSPITVPLYIGRYGFKITVTVGSIVANITGAGAGSLASTVAVIPSRFLTGLNSNVQSTVPMFIGGAIENGILQVSNNGFLVLQRANATFPGSSTFDTQAISVPYMLPSGNTL